MPEFQDEQRFKMADDNLLKFYGIGGDDRCVLRTEDFIERAPKTNIMTVMSVDDAIPELSSFRPTASDPQDQSGPSAPFSRLRRTVTTPVGQSSSVILDTPAWMRPMHLVDTGKKSIYKNVHDDGPIRHALCLWCYRTGGEFRKVHRHGYESCGRAEVLDSHY